MIPQVLQKLHITKTLCFSIFRFFFGLLMIEQVASLVPFVYDLQNSTLVLHYPYLDFIEAYSLGLIAILKYTAISAAFLLAIGILPRISALLFCLSFGYLFLIDMSFYNNHYYLWCLLSFLFVLVDTDKSISIIDILRGHTDKQISDFAVQSFKILITIVYLYAAIVKINPDWLQGYPATLWFENRGFSNARLLGILMSYSGLMYDALMPVLLWFYARKIVLIVPYFLFHLINAQLFNIGMFPYVMILAWLLFYASDVQPLNVFLKELQATLFTNLKTTVFVLFMGYNILFPLRFLLYEGRTSWHRQGYYFSWRMMLDNYEPIDFKFRVKLPSLNEEYYVQFSKMITYRQFQNTYNDAYCIWKVAQKLKEDAKLKYKEPNPEVYNIAVVALNQHPAKILIDKDLNLAAVHYSLFKSNKFINEF